MKEERGVELELFVVDFLSFFFFPPVGIELGVCSFSFSSYFHRGNECSSVSSFFMISTSSISTLSSSEL